MVELRHAHLEDAEAIAALHARSWRETYRGDYADAFLDGDLIGERRGVWKERLSNAPEAQLVLVAIEAGELAGFVCVADGDHPEWGALVDNLHVATPFKGRGIGAALLERSAHWLEARSPERGVYLLVLESNTVARRFYEHLGARDDGLSIERQGGAQVRSRRYAWPAPAALAAGVASRSRAAD